MYITPNNIKRIEKTISKNRLVTEGGSIGIRFFNENNWHTTVFGNMISKIENDTFEQILEALKFLVWCQKAVKFYGCIGYNEAH